MLESNLYSREATKYNNREEELPNKRLEADVSSIDPIRWPSESPNVIDNKKEDSGKIYLQQAFSYHQKFQWLEKSNKAELQLHESSIALTPYVVKRSIFSRFGQLSITMMSNLWTSVTQATRRVTTNKKETNIARIFLEQAIIYRESQRYSEAIQACEAGLKINPQLVDAYKVLGDIFQRQGRLLIAISYYQKAIAIKPNFAEAYAELGNIYQQQQQWQQAKESYQKALELKPDFPQVYQQLALIQQNLDSPQRVQLRLNQAQAITNHNDQAQAETHPNLLYPRKQLLLNSSSDTSIDNIESQSNEKSDDLDSQKTLKQENNVADQQVVSGDKAAKKKQWQDAILHYQKALLLNSKLIDAYIKLGKVFIQAGERAQAMLCFQEGIKNNPRSYELYFNLGTGFTQENNWEQATQCYRQAIKLNPGYWEALHNLGSVLGHQKLWSEAITVYRQAVRLKPDYPWAYNDLGLMLLQSGKPEEAIAAIRKAIALKSDFVEAYCNFGDAFVQVSQWRKAITAYQSATQIQANFPGLSQKLSYALFRQSEDYKKTALDQIMQAIKQEPNNIDNYHQALAIDSKNVELYVGLGNAFLTERNLDDAISAYQLAVELEPKNIEATIRLTNALRSKDPRANINNLVNKLLNEQNEIIEVERDSGSQGMAIANDLTIDANLTLPHSDSPIISIIIPVYNQLDYTLQCLFALTRNIQQDTLVEVIVINDCSEDQTPETLDQVLGLTLINNPQNLGFIHSCNKGAEIAKGKYLYFLNNDTEIQPKAIESLLETFQLDTQVGAVGSKLIYPEGSLQEAGGIIWQDATGWNYGRRANPFDPKYNYPREVDYCSGASLMVKKEIFDSLGGFDRNLAPAYYEDTDLCFAIRHQLGLKVFYQPKSEVIHYEGISSGNSTASGVKQYQIVNAKKFQKKWQQQLETQQYFPNQGNVNIAKAARKYQGTKTILVIDSYVPCYDKDSGSRRLFQLLQIFRELNYHVIFVADNGFKEEPYVTMLQGINIEVLYTQDGYGQAISQQVQERLAFVDIAWIAHPENYAKYSSLIRQYRQIKLVYDTIDLHYLRMKRAWELSPQSRNIENMRLWLKMQSQELHAAQDADLTVTISTVERDILQKQKIKNLAVVPNLHSSYGGKQPDFQERSGLLFIGGYNHPPNIDAVSWLCEKIMPLVWQKLPQLTVTLLGSNPTHEVTNLAQDSRVIVPGYIENVTDHFLTHRVFVAPLRYGAGMKGKIGQSLEYALPIISTEIGVEGMNLVHERNVLEANTAEEFAMEIIRLYQDASLWAHLASNCADAIAPYKPDRIKTNLTSILENLT